ncbi:unnamed protein product, partial [Effrenium voratum]
MHGYGGRELLKAAFAPVAGDSAEVFSESAKQWLPATVVACDGQVVTVAYARNSDSVHKALPLGHPSLRLSAASSAAPAAPAKPARRVCRQGVKCKERGEHLKTMAHPFDPDYQRSCAREGLAAEPATLHGLFAWMDTDGSGKISRK